MTAPGRGDPHDSDGSPSDDPSPNALSRRSYLGLVGAASLALSGCGADDPSTATPASGTPGGDDRDPAAEPASGTHSGDATVSGTLRRWHRVTLDVAGPQTEEAAEPNPFRDYRLDVIWTAPSGRTLVVPGYYAADGNAADTGATGGAVWRSHLAPDEVGTWRYRVSFRRGAGVAVDPWLADGAAGDVAAAAPWKGNEEIDLAAAPGEPVTADAVGPDGTGGEDGEDGADGTGGEDGADGTGGEDGAGGGGDPPAVDGATGAITVAESDAVGRDFRARGRLAHVGEHYLQLLGSGEPFLKNGSNSPENFLAYEGFDGTRDVDGSFLHAYDPHVDDWTAGDPTWSGASSTPRGKGIVGAVNYLASQGVNSQYVLTYSVDGGDGGDVWPWTGPSERTRFDCSKLAQWERVFAHMNRRGVAVHLLTQERENDRAMHDGDLGPERRLYYRELVARFAHHPALFWNLGEETTNTTGQLRAYAAHLRALDPYDHPIVVHTLPDEHDAVYEPLLGFEGVSGPSIQTDSLAVASHVRDWRERSGATGQPWAVMADELGDYRVGVPEDGATYRGVSQDDLRRSSLWGALMAGAAGAEWYFGYETQGGDLELEDFRSRHDWWAQTRHAHAFVSALPLPDVAPAPDRVQGPPAQCLAGAGALGAYFPEGVTEGSGAAVALDPGEYRLRWFDPRTGEWAEGGTVEADASATDPQFVAVGTPPFDADAALLVSGTD